VKLQVNTAGAWKALVEFDAERRAEVVRALHRLDSALGCGAKWSLVNDDGEREWLQMSSKPKSLPPIDFTQGHLNGYVPGAPNECYCFHVVKGKYCGAAKRWPGHGSLHEFVAEQVPR
jgi:hypothetical protein